MNMIIRKGQKLFIAKELSYDFKDNSYSLKPYTRIIYSEKTIEGYLDFITSLKFNTIYTDLNMHAFHSSRYLQSKCMFNLNHAPMVKVQYSSIWFNHLY